MKQLLLVLFSLCLLQPMTAQQPDSLNNVRDTLLTIVPDSSGFNKKKSKLNVTIPPASPTAAAESASAPKNNFFNRFFIKKYPNPRAAALLAIIPGGGQAYNISQGDAAISALQKAVGGLQKRAMEVRSFAEFESRYQWFLLPAIILLLLEMFVSYTRKKETLA